VISQGIYTDNINIATSNQSGQAAMQAYMASSAIVSAYQSSWYETRTNSVTTGYYTNTVFPTKNNDGTGSALLDLSYSYYDNYSLTQNVNPDYTYKNQNLSATEGGVQYTEVGATTAPTTGLLTMTRKKTIGAGFNNNYIWLINVVFYDKNLHPIQVRSNNQLNYTAATNTTPELVTDYMTNLPDFTGKPLVTKVAKNAGAAGTTTVLTVATYDTHNERLLYVDQTYNNQPIIRIASYEYNEMGQLVKKNLAPYTGTAISANVTLGPANSLTSTSPPTTVTASNSIVISPGPAGSTGAAQSFVVPAGATFSATIIPTALQSVDLRYNIRGQLLSINNSTLTNDGVTNGDANDLFGMQIMYDQPDAALSNVQASYSGKISAVKWMTVDEKFNKTNERSYIYNYDLLNRLTAATYGERLPGSTTNINFSTNGGAFNENGITYDENGNFITLNRNALVTPSGTTTPVQSSVDQLTYAYSSTIPNQLQSVSDASGTYAAGYGFTNITGITAAVGNPTYQYDPNGNLVADPYKGIKIGYNVLNRTDNIQMVNGPNNAAIATNYRYINYTYDASGGIIRKQQYDNGGSLITTTDYIGGFVYLTQGTGTPALSYFPMSEGRVINSAGTAIPEFIITDQQGNARFSFQAQGATGIKIIQENSYYAFGLIMPNSPISMPTLPNKRLYNGGAEWQNDYSNLPDYYQTFYRNYDAALGRFVGADPMGESASSMTNYQYANNNPISFNDPLGNTSNSASFDDGGGGGSTIVIQQGDPYTPDPPTGNTSDQGGSGPGDYGYQPFYYLVGPGPTKTKATPAAPEHYISFITPIGGLPITGESQALDGFSSISLANYDLDNGINAITEASATSASDGLDRTFDISDNDLKSDIWQGMLNSSNAYNPFIGSNATAGSSANANQGGPRPDADGYLTLQEANDWYRNGNGQKLTVDINKLGLSNIYASDFDHVGSKMVVNLLLHSNDPNAGMVFGNITLKLYPGNIVKAYDDTYDFDMKSWANPLNWGRNIETVIGAGVAGQGTPYNIAIQGGAQVPAYRISGLLDN